MPVPLTISCSSKSRLVLPSWFLPFWYLLTWVVPDKFQKSSKMIACICKWSWTVVCCRVAQWKCAGPEVCRSNWSSGKYFLFYITLYCIKLFYIYFSMSLSGIAKVCGILTDLSPRPSVVCVCRSGKCTVAKWLNGPGCCLGWWVGSVEGWVS